MQNLNARVTEGVLAMFDEMNRHTNAIVDALAAYNTTTDQDEKASLIAKIAASGVQIAKAWSGMVMLGRVGAMLGLDPSVVINAAAIEKNDDNAN